MAHPQIIDLVQLPGDPCQLSIVNHPGQHSRQPDPADHLGVESPVLNQEEQRHIQKQGLHTQQLLRHLTGGGDLHRETRGLPLAGVNHRPRIFAQRRLFPAAPQSGELVQNLPAHAVDCRSRETQPRFHHSFHLGADIGRAAGFGQAGGELLHREGPAHRRLRPGAYGFAHIAQRVLNRQHGGILIDNHVKLHRNQGILHRFIGGPGLCQKGPVLAPLLPDAEHGRTCAAPIVAVGKALAAENGLQPVHLSPGHPACIYGPPVNSRHRGHVFRPLHPALQLHRGHSHLLQLP